MKKLLLTTITAAGLVLSGQAAATPFYLDLSDDGMVNPVGEIDQLDLSYVSNTEVDTATGSLVTRAGISLIGYTFGGVTAPAYTDLEDLVTESGGETNTFTSTPNFPGAGLDVTGPSWTKLTFDLYLEGTLTPTVGVDYTSGYLDIYSFDAFDYGAGATQVMTTELFAGGINPGEQVVQSLVTSTSITAAGQDMFFFGDGVTFQSFEDYISATLVDIILEASQTVSVLELEQNIANSTITNGTTVLVSDDHNAGVEFRVPAPATIALFGLGLLGLAGSTRKRRS
ncbi:PEP-CTERM sorting domain-containing protein [Alteromonas sp. MMG017]|uniref:PEP-CTERM sorting domain-containing protein n=1 Tax=Alteromonas sp. MMG017 TaxID=2822692 RepID=UPI001AB85ECF|nr:PEP-CTERM sorting domain-containing protein [Alteromonas sp. MMG017]MBQ4829558.1 PEP-CTERM sorting domain-containing protein [Alteromonas sp. MMG017]|mmetsp:Transcript_26843/g.70484  ORF Transcript_26843/g.70484 Transcript_26843/m.70484 type:complete len:284 (+) Transcript_26843:31-882(+)